MKHLPKTQGERSSVTFGGRWKQMNSNELKNAQNTHIDSYALDNNTYNSNSYPHQFYDPFWNLASEVGLIKYTDIVLSEEKGYKLINAQSNIDNSLVTHIHSEFKHHSSPALTFDSDTTIIAWFKIFLNGFLKFQNKIESIDSYLETFVHKWNDFLSGWIRQIVALCILISGSVLLLPVYRVHTKVNVDEDFNVIALNGALWIEYKNVFNQYQPRTGTYSVDYLTSVFQPQVIMDGVEYSMYRMSPDEIYLNDVHYYYYVSEDGLVLSKEPEWMEVYDTNLVTTKTKSVYPSKYTLLNSSWGEIFDSYVNNTIQMNLDCNNEPTSNCKGVLNRTEFNVVDHPTLANTFIFENNFVFEEVAKPIQKQVFSSMVVPLDFEICVENTCMDTTTQNYVEQDEFPVWVYENGRNAKIMNLAELQLSDFLKSSMFLPDRLSQDSSEPVMLQYAKTYSLVHKSSGIIIDITPHNPSLEPSYLPKFRTIRFASQECDIICNNQFDIHVRRI